MRTPLPEADVVVVGAGIVGLAHAFHAHRRGLRVVVVEQSSAVVGASVQNFGHACIGAQSGEALRYARAGRQHWLALAAAAGFEARATGTTVVARRDDEQEVLAWFADTHGPGRARLLDAQQVLQAVPVDPAAVVGGLHLVEDLRVDPRRAAPAIAAHLEREGVAFNWRTAATGVEPGMVHTTRGTITAPATFVTVGHDLDRLFPELAETAGVRRCRLHMLRARLRLSRPLATPLLTGWSLLRYSGFEAVPATAAVRERLFAQHPELAALDLNQMYTQQADGTVIVGDTHERDISASPFQAERGFEVLLEVTRELFGLTRIEEVDVVERWQGVYASAPGAEFLRAQPMPGTHVTTVTTGIGMTTALGLAEESCAEHIPQHRFASAARAATAGSRA